jgi:hypothetical protein
MCRIISRITEFRFDKAGPKQLAWLLDTLPPGRRRVAAALIADDCGRTYRAVATQLCLSLGTVHQHLRRIRLRHPQVYAALMQERDRQLAVRHQQALERAEAHSARWHQITMRRHSFRFVR